MLVDGLRLVGRLLEPSEFLALLILGSAAAAWWRRPRLTPVLSSIAAAIVLLLGVLPGGAWLALPLETRFPVAPALPEDVAGIIVLGGTERLAQSEAWGQPTLSDPTPIAVLLALGRRYPQAKLVFSGGAVSKAPGLLNEAHVVRDFLTEIGSDPSRVIYEERSRNTLENALFTRELVKPKSHELWILVTQAISMPRSVAVFRHAGWDVIPFPAGYLTDGQARISLEPHLLGGLGLASIAVHEWGGLLAYRLLGYTSELFPGRLP